MNPVKSGLSMPSCFGRPSSGVEQQMSAEAGGYGRTRKFTKARFAGHERRVGDLCNHGIH